MKHTISYFQRWISERHRHFRGGRAGRQHGPVAPDFAIALGRSHVTRVVFLLFAGLFVVGNLQAHDVVWWPGALPGVLDFYYPSELHGSIYVAPSTNEPCTVVVNLDPASSTLVSAQALPPNPENTVEIFVQILRAPTGHVETATISGEWHATGIPNPLICDATTPQRFSVPVEVINLPYFWHVMPASDKQSLSIDAGVICALQMANSPAGPWLNVGQGQTFTVNSEMPSGFFHRLKQVGGFVNGIVTDPSGKPLSGATLGLLYGGPTASTDATGAFAFPRLPWGMNLIAITNPIGASLNVAVPATNNTTVAFKVAMVAAVGPVTNACNCTPWCAIGFGSLPGGQTPVYYAGGANSPQGAPTNCGQPQVTVTTPSGATYPIMPGSARYQNSGPNPASGAWTVTTVVCGQTKSCTITVP